ncbi:MAG TPA: hypothetical protein VF518_00460, partial [Polyangia bacterium]
MDCNTGGVTLSWKAAATAASHDVYVGNDVATVQSASHASTAFKGNQTGPSIKLTGINSLKTT